MLTFGRRELIPRRRDLPALAALYFAYSVAVWLGLQWSLTRGGGSPIWPAAGLAFAGLLMGGLRLWPALLLGRFTVAIITGSPQPWWADLLIAAITTAAAAAPAWIIARTGPLDRRLGSLRDMSRVILLGGGLGAAISLAAGLVVASTDLVVSDVGRLVENWVFGVFTGVLLVSPPIIAFSRREDWRIDPLALLHFAACLAAVAGVSAHVFLQPDVQPIGTWQVFPVLVWAALAFNVRGASVALAVVSLIATWSAVQAMWPNLAAQPEIGRRVLMAQQFLAATSLTILMLAAIADERRAQDRIAKSEKRLREETEALEILNETGALIAADLELESVVQTVTDAGVALTGAKYGAFFYNVMGEGGEAYMLFTLSGAPREAFEQLGMPRNTKVFAPTFGGEGVMRSDDIQKDERYGQNAPLSGQPKGHLPVRSYLAAPVMAHSGEVLGGLFFGHPDAGVFAPRTERLVTGLASQAAIAIDNARLYQAAQREIAERTRAEEHQRLLINELNHRVKNTLATVQSIAAQTRRTAKDPRASYEAFIERLMALSRAHDVLTKQRWEGADLTDIVAGAVRPFEAEAGGKRFKVSGPSVWLEPQPALALAMALHELATNAVKYGALSVAEGRVSLGWTVRPDEHGLALELTWRESKGPKVAAPVRRGFGSRLLERGLAGELNGTVSVDYRADGLVCTMQAKLPAADEAAPEAIAAAE